MPDVTKNTGMSSPKARPVSFASSCWSPPQAALDAARSQPRTHRARCPSRTGWPRSTAARAEARSAVRWSGRWLRTGPDQGRSREVSRRSRADGSVVSTAISADRQHDQRPARDCGCSAGLPWRAPGRAPPCAVVHDRITEPGAELAAVLENRQQGAKGGRRQRDRHRHLGVHRSTQSNEPHNREGKPHADQPGHHCPTTAPRGQLLQLDLIAGQQEQPAGPSLCNSSIASSREARPGDVGSGEDAGHQEQHHLRQQLAVHQPGQ
jgi:hypothetical protein